MNSARTAGPIVTDEAPFDSPIRRNEDGANFGSISSKWHVARAALCCPVKAGQKKSHAPTGQTGAATEPKLAGHKRTIPT